MSFLGAHDATGVFERGFLVLDGEQTFKGAAFFSNFDF
jgi:hypothetical protein